jgi:hypothetical protein
MGSGMTTRAIVAFWSSKPGLIVADIAPGVAANT